MAKVEISFRERVRQLLGGATFAVVVVAFIYFAWVTGQQNVLLAQQAESAQRTETALCIFRDDLETRVKSAQQFLRDNPDGIPGISPELLQQSIDNQQRTILALQLLNCSSE